MNFNPFRDALISQLKDSLFAPKDHFERAKRSATRTLVLPLIAVLGGESVLVALVGAISSLEFRSGEVFFKLAGSASDSFLVLSGVVALSFFSVVGSNLYYARHLRRTQAEIESLAKEARLAASYEVLKSRFDSLASAKRVEDAYSVAVLMFKLYPEYVEQDPDFLQSLLSDGNSAAIKQLQAIIPERPKLQEGGARSAARSPNPTDGANG